jgi:thioredoxin-related protein
VIHPTPHPPPGDDAALLESLQKNTPKPQRSSHREEQILGARYSIREAPTQVFYDKSGNEISRNAGMLTAEELAQQIAKIGVN